MIFAAASSCAVVVGVQLHHSGQPFSSPPTADESTALLQPSANSATEPTPADSSDALADVGAESVVSAIPIQIAQVIEEELPASPPLPSQTESNVAPSPANAGPGPTGKVEPVLLTLASSAALPVAYSHPFEVSSRVEQGNYQPFVDSLRDTLRNEAPKAIPLPMIYQAVLLNDNEWLRQLLKAGFAVNHTTPMGDTALCAAVKARNQEAVELLLLSGADPKTVGRDGQAPLALACLMRTERIIPALLSAGADPNTTYQWPLPDALLKSLPYPDLKDSLRNDRGVTVLMAVAARGDSEGTVALLQHGAKPEQPTKRQYRYPINFAAEQEYLFIMRILLGRPPESEPDILVTVDLSQQKAFLSKNGEIIDKTSVSTGREGYDTPQGRYLVTDKHSSWTSTIYHVEMPWFMRLNCSSIGLHSGYVTGEPASHGCIRLPYEKVKKWFGIVKVGDEVQIVR